jgi:hypothetical protein
MAANYSSCARAHHLLSVIALLAVAGYAAAASGSPHGGRSVVTAGKKSAVLPLRELKWFAAARKIRGRYAQPMQAQILGKLLHLQANYLIVC